MKIPSKDTLERQNDDLWRKCIKERDHFQCQYPGCDYNGDDVEAHHIWGRANKGSRFLPDNGITLCPPDHKEAHEHPKTFRAMVEDRVLGPDRMAAITQAARAVCRWTVEQLMEIRERLREERSTCL